MPGLPRKYAKMGFAKGWRAYKASKRKASPAPKTRSAPRSVKPTATRRSRARKFIARRRHVVPLADGLTAIYTLDGGTDGNIGAAAGHVIGTIAGQSGKSLDSAGQRAATGVQWAVANPKKALIGAGKNLAFAVLTRKALGFIGVPRTINFFGKKIQVR